MSNFYIEAHDDYHDIIPKKGWKAIELGCWLTDVGYCKYFGLYYKGRKPSVGQIFPEVSKSVVFGENQVNGIDVSLTPEFLKEEISLNLKIHQIKCLVNNE